MIYLITGRSHEYDQDTLQKEGIEMAKGKDFLNWLENYEGRTQLDTETNVVRDIYGWVRDRKGKTGWTEPILNEDGEQTPIERECYVVQIGDEQGINQWIFDIPGLKGKKLNALMIYLKSDTIKLIHNALFDYTVIKWNFGVDIKNIRDTYLMSKILFTGRDMGKGFHSLAGCAQRYLGIDISKAAQTTFDGNIMTADQIRYAAIDVAILTSIHDAMQPEIDRWGLETIMKLECALVRPYGDAMCENFYLNIPKWKKNIKLQEKNLKEITENLHSLIKEYFEDDCKELGLIQKEDHYDFKWGSPKKKRLLMKLAYPTLPEDCTTIPKYKNFLKNLEDDLENDVDREDPDILNLFLARDFEQLELLFIQRYAKEMDELGIFTPEGEMLINFNSPAQTTQLFQLIDPSIESSGREVIDKINHPIAKEFRKFAKASKLVSSYGKNFLDWIAPDGQIRVADFNQILDTGRSSMKLFQLLPQDNNYRNCFQPNNPDTGTRDDGEVWKMIGADYSSQEICVVASFAGEDSMLEALEKGYDLHSISASLLFPKEWKELGGEAKPKGKPRDDQPELNKFRSWSKSTSFGLFYGMSAVGLADGLGLPATTLELMEWHEDETEDFMATYADDYTQYCKEYKKGRKSKTAKREFLKKCHEEGIYLGSVVTGDDLVQRFYKAYPKVRAFLVEKGETAKQLLHVRTPDDFGRIRFFDEPDYESGYGAIERAAMNMPIQSSGANMTKYAIVLLKKYIEENNLQDKLKFILPIHDEIQCLVREDFSKEGLDIVINCMETAGNVVLKNKLQKAEGEITDVWMK